MIILKQALEERCGFVLKNDLDCEQLSIAIFIQQGNYISRTTISKIFLRHTMDLAEVKPAVLSMLQDFSRIP